MIIPAVNELAEHVSVTKACELMGRSRATHYRDRAAKTLGPAKPRQSPGCRLTEAERDEVLTRLTSDEFVDKSVGQAWTILLDQGVYLCSMSTMYRILREHNSAGERRKQATHPPKSIPELQANRPGQAWCWDITKIRGPRRGSWFDLYVIIDIFSRYIVGWRLEHHEDSAMAKELIEQAIGAHELPDVVHADRGTSMTSKPVAQLLVDLGITRSHSRPRVSNDNPHIESHFKTMKYAPAFPGYFESIEAAREFFQLFFEYYNNEHRHSGIAMHTPASVHYGTWTTIQAQRQATLDAAYEAHPDRFCGRRPLPPQMPKVAWINPPTKDALITAA